MKIFERIYKCIRMITFHRIRNILLILRKEGWIGIKYHFFLVRDKEEGRAETFFQKEYDITSITKADEKRSWQVDELEPIIFDACREPLASIIIPAYNQAIYTYYCLKYIQKEVKNIGYEIIIGDDASTDITAEIEKWVKGIRVIHHRINCQFLRNCNKISEEASGKYIVFLNNDTQVQKGWLEALVNVMERDEEVGLVGSKLVYPDGLVQEAGGIVWKDAHVLQYGNGRQSGEKKLNFKREADYISGASIMIRKELWDAVGGFDDRFVPAYYEDVDLAFQVRERGYKVIYQPESEVIHFEGATEGGNKERDRMIERNREKFVEKWRKVLERQYYGKEEYEKVVGEMKEYQYLE